MKPRRSQRFLCSHPFSFWRSCSSSAHNRFKRKMRLHRYRIRCLSKRYEHDLKCKMQLRRIHSAGKTGIFHSDLPEWDGNTRSGGFRIDLCRSSIRLGNEILLVLSSPSGQESSAGPRTLSRRYIDTTELSATEGVKRSVRFLRHRRSAIHTELKRTPKRNCAARDSRFHFSQSPALVSLPQ